MPHHASQHSFLFAVLPASTSASVTIPRKQSIGSLNTGRHSFYNLHKDSNKSNLDLTRFPPQPPHPSSHSVYSGSAYPSGHSIYSSRSNASSCLSLASSLHSVDKVQHAFGSLPPPGPTSISSNTSSFFAASASSLPLSTTSSSLALPSSSASSFTSHHHPQQRGPHFSGPQSWSCSSSLSDISCPSPRPLLLPPVATLGSLPPRKRIPNTIPPLDTRTLSLYSSLPSTTSLNSCSTTMTATSPSSAGALSISATAPLPSSAPVTPTRSHPMASMAITELVISEAQYIATVHRVGSALALAAKTSLAAGRKESATIRTVMERWEEMTGMHSKFHDDIVSVQEDLHETADLINELLVTIEPILIDHGRDLSNALKKLTRRDHNSEHTLAEWDSALRQPLEHLAVYGEWFQRVDPQTTFTKNYRSHLNGLIYKIKMVTESNPNPRNVLRRLSTMAKGVIKRRLSTQLLILPSAAVAATIPETPTTPTPNTPHSMATTESPTTSASEAGSLKAEPQSASSTSSYGLPLPQAVQDLAIADPQSETVMDPVFAQRNFAEDDIQESIQTTETKAAIASEDVSSGPVSALVDMDDSLPPLAHTAETYLSVHPLQKYSQLSPHQNRSSSACSAMSSVGSLTVASISSESIHSKNSNTDTLVRKSSSISRQKFLEEREAKRATLRVGAHELIQAKADSLQSPTYVSRPSIDSLRVVAAQRESEKKPPVKSLINFWETVSEPLEV